MSVEAMAMAAAATVVLYPMDTTREERADLSEGRFLPQIRYGTQAVLPVADADEAFALMQDGRTLRVRSMSVGDVAIVTREDGTRVALGCAPVGWTPLDWTL